MDHLFEDNENSMKTYVNVGPSSSIDPVTAKSIEKPLLKRAKEFEKFLKQPIYIEVNLNHRNSKYFTIYIKTLYESELSEKINKRTIYRFSFSSFPSSCGHRILHNFYVSTGVCDSSDFYEILDKLKEDLMKIRYWKSSAIIEVHRDYEHYHDHLIRCGYSYFDGFKNINSGNNLITYFKVFNESK